MKLQRQTFKFNNADHANRLAQNNVFSTEDRWELLDEIQALKTTIEKLEYCADTDPLVPIKNHRAFIRELERAQTVVSRYNIPSCIVFFDLNRFKEINDRYGHSIGDELLIKIGKCLKASVRESDVVARLGGDEFGIILFKTDEELAKTKAAILAQQISKQQITLPSGEVSVTAAWGMSTCRPNNSAKQIIDRADRDMYRNKHHGKSAPSAQPVHMARQVHKIY